jgi:hypothetical protein
MRPTRAPHTRSDLRDPSATAFGALYPSPPRRHGSCTSARCRRARSCSTTPHVPQARVHEHTRAPRRPAARRRGRAPRAGQTRHLLRRPVRDGPIRDEPHTARAQADVAAVSVDRALAARPVCLPAAVCGSSWLRLMRRRLTDAMVSPLEIRALCDAVSCTVHVCAHVSISESKTHVLKGFANSPRRWKTGSRAAGTLFRSGTTAVHVNPKKPNANPEVFSDCAYQHEGMQYRAVRTSSQTGKCSNIPLLQRCMSSRRQVLRSGASSGGSWGRWRSSEDTLAVLHQHVCSSSRGEGNGRPGREQQHVQVPQ